MKMKKIILLFSMIAVLFSLTACSDGQGEVNFRYTDTDIIGSSVGLAYNLQNMDDANKAYIEAEGEEVYRTALSNFENVAEECGGFKGYLSKEDGSTIMIDLTNSEITEEELTQFLSFIDANVEESGENVLVTLKAVYDKRQVEISFVYEADSAYAYGGSTTPYKPSEITVAPEYTFGEQMGKAGSNTLMGMGTVFVVLIFISLIISQFERLDKALNSVGTALRNGKQAENKEEAGTVNRTVSAQPAATPQNPMDDTQLVAVITAAIAAANSSQGGSDRLVVRSIRKAKR